MDERHAEVISRMIWSKSIYDPMLSDFLYLRGPFREEITMTGRLNKPHLAIA